MERRSVDLADGGRVRVTRVTPDGDEVVETPTPVLVTISNELGEPRYPTMKAKMQARRKQATVVPLADLGLPPEDLQTKVALKKQYVPTVQGDCEFIAGDTPVALAEGLVARLRAENLI